MKKLLFAVVMMLSSTAMFAQQEVGTWSIQPKVGLNIATLTKADGADPRYGLVAGGELMYQVTDMVGISGGVLYSMQGCKGSDEGDKVTIKMDYINVPILANVYVVPGLAVKLGLQPGFKVNSSVKAESNGYKLETDADGVKSFDLSIPIGLSYEFNNIVIDGRYNFGVTKAIDESDSKNSVFQFTVGYKFAL